MLSAIREPLVVPSEFDYFKTLFKNLAIYAVMFSAHCVVARSNNCAEAPSFAWNGATTHAEFHATAGDDVSKSKIFGKS